MFYRHLLRHENKKSKQLLTKKNMTTPSRPYSAEEELRELSFQYIIDAHQFAKQAEILLDDTSLTRSCEYHIGYLSKISVMLYMSIECSLKSMICTSHVGEVPHSVYWKRIRPASHFFTKLTAEITGFTSKIDDSTLEGKLNQLATADVSERYCLEVTSASNLLGDFNIDESDLNDQIQENRKLLDTAKQLRQKVWDLRKDEFDGHRTLPPNKVKAVLKRIKTK